MTLPATAQLIDLDAVVAAAGAAAARLAALGELDIRPLDAGDLSARFPGGVALSVTTGGTNPGRLGLVAGADASAAMAGQGDGVDGSQAVMAEIVVVLTDRTGDLEPQGVEVLDPEAGNGPALEPDAISVGLFRGDELVAAIGFVPGSGAPAEPIAQVFQALAPEDNTAVEVRRMHLLRDVEMGVSVELGRARMAVRDLLALAPGAIVELDKAAGAPVDVLVNGTLMARGQVVVIDEEFAVRISEIVTPEQDGRPGI